ncbi:hypothetical protein MJO29_011403 [Puccinia striiformis f. sp. tritici]|nr:hypothetical protein MJO29_011403 [Puccinia striiformis f. sp. tritici]
MNHALKRHLESPCYRTKTPCTTENHKHVTPTIQAVSAFPSHVTTEYHKPLGGNEILYCHTTLASKSSSDSRTHLIGGPTSHNISRKTVNRCICATKAWHLFHDAPYPNIVKGKVAVAPILLKHLHCLSFHLSNVSPFHEAVFDIALVAFWGLARLAELTYTSAIGQGRKDCKTRNLSAHITLTASGGPLCPVQAMLRHRQDTHGSNIPFFGFWSLGRRVNLTHGATICLTQQVLILTGHSFRVGSALLRHAMGILTDINICRLGRWTSKCYLLYIRPYSPSQRQEAESFFRNMPT